MEVYGSVEEYSKCKHGMALEINLKETEFYCLGEIQHLKNNYDLIRNVVRRKDP